MDLKAKIQQLIDAAERDRVVRKELLEAGELDKPQYNARMQQVHEENADLLAAFLDTYGWPYPSQYGKEANTAAWFIAIHAIARPPFIKKIGALLEEASKAGKIAGKYYANFHDRIALYEGRKQRYGTHLFPSAMGWQALYLEDPAQVDSWRETIGLPTVADWIAECEADETGYKDIDQTTQQAAFEKWCKAVGWRQ